MTAAMAGTTPRLYATDTPALKLTVIGAEKVLGSAFDDVMNGSMRADTFAGGAGNDQISGSGGDDILFSGTSAGNDYGDYDTLLGGDGADSLVVQAGATARLTGGAGADKFYLSADASKSGVTITDPEASDTL